MSDTEMPRDGEEPDREVAADEPVAEEAPVEEPAAEETAE